jgi:ABC-2 type transport system permease protein
VRSGLQLYLRYLSLALRAQLQYRASLVMQMVGTLLITSVEFLGLWALFARFGQIRGWTLPEAALLYGMVEVSFAVSEFISRGLDTFGSLVLSGAFDRLLLRPRSTLLQLVGQRLAPRALGRLAQGLAVLLWAAHTVRVSWSAGKVLLLAASLAGGACLFLGLFVVQATIVFWSVEPLEIMAAFTHGGVETGHYPLTIYRPWFRRFFTFVVPIGCVNYLPLRALQSPGGVAWVSWLAPWGGFLFLLVSTRIWRLGVARYVSTGS